MGAEARWGHANGTHPSHPVGADPTDAGERRRLTAELEERLRFETLLSDLSLRFINLPVDEVDREIEAVLGRIVEFLGLDRSTIFQFSDGETAMLVSHCWAAPGFESLKGLIPRDVFPWALARALRGHSIVYSCVDELPDVAALDKATIRRVGPKSNVTFPLIADGGAVFGALAFGQMSRERAWPEDLVQRLRLIAQILANALLRRRSEQKLRVALSEIKQLKDRLQQENVYLRQEAGQLQDHEHVVERLLAVMEASAGPPVLRYHTVSDSKGLEYLQAVRLGAAACPSAKDAAVTDRP